MLESLVQNDFEINIQHVMRRMRTMNAHVEVVTLRDADGAVTSCTYGEVIRRADRLANALTQLGVRAGERVATFSWNTQEHLEAYLAVPCMGAVLHTLNIRLSEEQLAYIINHAQDRVIIVDDSLIPLLERVLPDLGGVEHFIVVGDGDSGSLPHVLRYEELLADQPDGFDYPDVPGRAAACLCYTSGTTGTPRGVLYGHRSVALHALAECLSDTLDVRSTDRVLPVVPMFHANAWGLPYTCGMMGAPLVMPNRFLQAEPLLKLIEAERVTFAAAVPTIWMDVLRTGAANPQAAATLRRVVCGGSAVPRSLMQRFEDQFGVRLVQGFGMTETSPLVAIAEAPAGCTGEQAWHYRSKTGRISPFVEARIVSECGDILDWDGEHPGELELRGPWIASGYYLGSDADDEKFHDGWLRTGDIATIDALGYIQITDRAKDVIKSGGEWISSVEMENALMSHPAILEAAVIAKPDDRWTERPLPCVVVGDGPATPEVLNEHLKGHFAKWQLPDEYAFISEVPKTSVGKFDKKVLRQQLSDGQLSGRQAVSDTGPAVDASSKAL